MPPKAAVAGGVAPPADGHPPRLDDAAQQQIIAEGAVGQKVHLDVVEGGILRLDVNGEFIAVVRATTTHPGTAKIQVRTPTATFVLVLPRDVDGDGRIVGLRWADQTGLDSVLDMFSLLPPQGPSPTDPETWEALLRTADGQLRLEKLILDNYNVNIGVPTMEDRAAAPEAHDVMTREKNQRAQELRLQVALYIVNVRRQVALHPGFTRLIELNLCRLQEINMIQRVQNASAAVKTATSTRSKRLHTRVVEEHVPLTRAWAELQSSDAKDK
jgi:hypothetical protein